MNIYSVQIGPKSVPGSGIGHMGGDRTIYIVTGSIQDAMSIAKTKLNHNEQVTSIYQVAEDAVIDYSVIQQGQQI
jgi:hypothetical protein